jgi:transcription initiation factor TFIID subunit TAF12
VSRATLHALIKQTLGVESVRGRSPAERAGPSAHTRALLSAPSRQVPPEVEELLLDVGDDFVEHCAAGAAALARHRGSDTLDASDVRLHVERVWNLPLPGHGGDDLHRAATASETQPHAARVAAIRRTLAAATHTAQQLK